MTHANSPVHSRYMLAFCCAILLTATTAPPVAADDDGPRTPRIDCTKPKNKTKEACKPHHGASDEAIINGAYWLAHTGRNAEALALLATIRDADNPRALNAIGFATRKLGNVDAALPYYRRALTLEPDYVQAREYLGEAFLAKGDLISARQQLSEIAGRGGRGCVSFAHLQSAITAFEARQLARS